MFPPPDASSLTSHPLHPVIAHHQFAYPHLHTHSAVPASPHPRIAALLSVQAAAPAFPSPFGISSYSPDTGRSLLTLRHRTGAGLQLRRFTDGYSQNSRVVSELLVVPQGSGSPFAYYALYVVYLVYTGQTCAAVRSARFLNSLYNA